MGFGSQGKVVRLRGTGVGIDEGGAVVEPIRGDTQDVRSVSVSAKLPVHPESCSECAGDPCEASDGFLREDLRHPYQVES